MQIWGILRETVPEKIGSAAAAQAGIAVYAGLVILILIYIPQAVICPLFPPASTKIPTKTVVPPLQQILYPDSGWKGKNP